MFIGSIIGAILIFLSFCYLRKDISINSFFILENTESTFKLIFAAIAGSTIGFERENKKRPAGLRTHSLVCIGAAISMIIPIEIFRLQGGLINFDVTRIGAQVISGIGFLGAGTIIRNGASVKGLTTAASLWVVGIIGLAIGAGLYIIGIVSTLIVIFILKVFGDFEYRSMIKKRTTEVIITTLDIPRQISSISRIIKRHHLQLKKLEVILEDKLLLEENDTMKIRVIVTSLHEIDFKIFYDELRELENILKVELIK